MAEPDLVLAAGAVVLRRARRGREVLLVHRPKYDDWSFPKGKLDPHEHATAAAVREVEEETGVRVHLGPPLPVQEYPVPNGELRTKRVHYWVGRLAEGEDGDVSSYSVNDEIDRVRWVPVGKAVGRLDYERDRALLAEALRHRRRTVPLVVLRHGKALPRKSWSGDDRARPLAEAGRAQAELLVPVLAALGVDRVVTSSSERCAATVVPYAEAAGVDLECDDVFSEEDATPARVARAVRRLVRAAEPTVLCTHRPVLPHVIEALGLEPTPLEVGALLATHHRKGRVRAVERLTPTDVRRA